jgi:hypothetical protein
MMNNEAKNVPVGPEDIRPVLQEFLQGQLVYKGVLLAVREKANTQREKAKARGTKTKLSRLLVEVQTELGRVEPGIDSKQEKIKRERLRPVV